MSNPVDDIRRKAFKDEMTYIIGEYSRIFSSSNTEMRNGNFTNRIDKYLEKHFSYYVQWHYTITNSHIIFWVSGILGFEFERFEVELKK